MSLSQAYFRREIASGPSPLVFVSSLSSSAALPEQRIKSQALSASPAQPQLLSGTDSRGNGTRLLMGQNFNHVSEVKYGKIEGIPLVYALVLHSAIPWPVFPSERVPLSILELLVCFSLC